MAKKLAKKRPPPPPPPPAPPSSSSDEEGSSSGNQQPITKSPNPKTPTNKQEADGESESGSSDEETVTKSPAPKTPTNNKGEGTDDGSESDSGDDKGDEEEAEKPRSDTKKRESVSTAAAAAAPALKPLGAGEESNKKGKDNGKGKSLFQRIWSLDDEITILKAIIEFKSKHGPFKRDGAGIRDFHHFVKDSLSLEVNDTQLYEKIRRLKGKYETAAARARKTGKAVKSGKPHDEKVYELSKEIWGPGNENEVKVNSKRAAKRAAAAVAAANDGGGVCLKRKYLFLNAALVRAGQDVSAEVLAALDPEAAMLFENKFKKQRVEDLKCKIHDLDLMKHALNSIVKDIESTD